MKALTSPDDQPVYGKPGYELDCVFSTHDIRQLIEPKLFIEGINSLPRIQRNRALNYKENFADMEHYAISKLLTNWKTIDMGRLVGPDQMQGWLTQCWWLTAYPQKYNRFRESSLDEILFLEVEDGKLKFMQKIMGYPVTYVERTEVYGIDTSNKLPEKAIKKFWLDCDYQLLIEEMANRKNITESRASALYGEISLPYADKKGAYQYSNLLGLSRLR